VPPGKPRPGGTARTCSTFHQPALEPRTHPRPSDTSEQTGLLCPGCGQRVSRPEISSSMMENTNLHLFLSVSRSYTSATTSLLLPAGLARPLPLAIAQRMAQLKSDPRFLFLVPNLRVSGRHSVNQLSHSRTCRSRYCPRLSPLDLLIFNLKPKHMA